jgi:hypothetical protein
MSKKPVDYDELFPGRFLKAGLFKGKAVTLTISDIDLEPLPQDNGKERERGVVSFKETKMQLALNSTNGQCMRAMFGRKPLDWIGKRVTFKPEKDRFGKEVVDAIRVEGSPDITGPIDVEIRMPRKKPKQRRLVPTGKGAGNGAAPEAEAPTEVLGHDEETGEVFSNEPAADGAIA